MLHAFKLYTGRDNASHVEEGMVAENDRTDVVAIHFKETPPHSAFDWHEAPEPQYVITLSGTLEPTISIRVRGTRGKWPLTFHAARYGRAPSPNPSCSA